jgi:Xaa-Pro aminopeptidase
VHSPAQTDQSDPHTVQEGIDLTNVMIFGDTRYPSLRHEIPISVPDPMAYVELDGKRHAFAGSLDVPRLRELGLEVLSMEELGLGEQLASGKTLAAAQIEAVRRGCERIGFNEGVTPRDFPLEAADYLRAHGIELTADGDMFDERRRRRTAAQVEGIRRGLRACEAAMGAVWDAIRETDGITCEELVTIANRAFVDNGAIPHEMLIVSSGAQSAGIHDMGKGPVERGQPILIDLFGRDVESGCWGDLTRTVCLGEPPERLREMHRHVRESQRLAMEALRPHIGGGEVYRVAAQYLADAGYPTRLDVGDEVLEDGFAHYLGHGLGLELHEAPTLDDGGETLVPGDVVTIEPGLYFHDIGGVRIEDVALVTADGYENLTMCPYELEL